MKLKLVYPTGDQKRSSEYPADLPNKWGSYSGYALLGLAKSGSDKYVCMKNENDEVYIEKLTLLRPRKWVAMEDTVRIDDDEEFNIIHNFFVKEKVL